MDRLSSGDPLPPVHTPQLPIGQFEARPGIIDLGWGHPGPELLPTAALGQAAVRVVERYGADALGYGYAGGPGPLIDWVCERLKEVDAVAPTPDCVVASAGNSQASCKAGAAKSSSHPTRASAGRCICARSTRRSRITAP